MNVNVLKYKFFHLFLYATCMGEQGPPTGLPNSMKVYVRLFSKLWVHEKGFYNSSSPE